MEHNHAARASMATLKRCNGEDSPMSHSVPKERTEATYLISDPRLRTLTCTACHRMRNWAVPRMTAVRISLSQARYAWRCQCSAG